jgi:predicted glycosyltransferase
LISDFENRLQRKLPTNDFGSIETLLKSYQIEHENVIKFFKLITSEGLELIKKAKQQV